MSAYLFPPAPQPALPIEGSQELFAVRRVFCVGRNYAAHAAEMGHAVDREAPFYFTKSAHHVALAEGKLPIPPRTSDYHHEIELVVALKSGGSNITAEDAMAHVFGFAVGLDMTRRDLQAASKAKRRSWDTGKDFEFSALSSPLKAANSSLTAKTGRIELKVNGTIRQEADLSDHIWSLPEIIADLSTLYTLEAGDLIMMGTPSGVAAVVAGDRLEGSIENIGAFDITLT